jgi:concentrative nucleoside transporter, CNT family
VTFGLTGFANFGSIAILIGTFGSISPNRRKEIAQFGISSASGRSSQGRSQT